MVTLCVALPRAALADETAAAGRIVSVGLFKNGLAIVKMEVDVEGPGTYRLDDVPSPVHGTFWVQSSSPVEAQVRHRQVEVPADQVAPGNLQAELAGKRVVVYFRGDKLPPVNGTVVEFKSKRTDSWGRAHAAFRGDGDAASGPSRYLTIQTPRGRSYIEASEIAYVESAGPENKVLQRKPVLLFRVEGEEKKRANVLVTFLTRGIGWAPSYRVDITDPKTLSVEQNAVVKNELVNLAECDISLISGFPSVQFAHVTSPLSPQTRWASFFQELEQRSPLEQGVRGNPRYQSIAMNSAVMGNDGNLGAGLGAAPTGEGVDLHYQSIGKRTLGEGDSLALTVARGSAPYQRIVEWLIPDTRNEHGHYAGPRREDTDDPENDSAWDALRFKNPLPFPMTTAPAMVVANGRFNGQRTCFWVNAGEETCLRVNKALSIRTRSAEHEEQAKDGGDDRQVMYIGGQRYRRSVVQGELAVANHRKEAVSLVIRRRFSGDLLSAEGSPKTNLREEGIWSVNRRNEVVWSLNQNPGDEKKLNYRYAVLVSF
jgi:hypothetical protein